MCLLHIRRRFLKSTLWADHDLPDEAMFFFFPSLAVETEKLKQSQNSESETCNGPWLRRPPRRLATCTTNNDKLGYEDCCPEMVREKSNCLQHEGSLVPSGPMVSDHLAPPRHRRDKNSTYTEFCCCANTGSVEVLFFCCFNY